MADPAAPPGVELSPEQLRRIEDALYRAVLGRVLRAVAVGVLVLAASGALVAWLTWSTLRARLVTEAVASLQADPALRSDLLAGLDLDSASIARLLDSLGAVALGRPGGDRGGAASEAELRRLMEQVLGEPPSSRAVAPPPRARR